LSYTFIPENLRSANLDPVYMDGLLAEEATAGHTNGPFTTDEAHSIFGGHFHTAPLGFVEKPSSSTLCLIRHHSRLDHQQLYQ